MRVKAFIRNRLVIAVVGLGLIVASGYLLPSSSVIPVEGASRHDWNHQTFWHARWGNSGVHKGIDIFAPVGQPVISATDGIVIFKGYRRLGGNSIFILGPQWRVHYYAHLREISTELFHVVRQGEVIGSVGRSGNAKRRPPHLHYSIMSVAPLPWRWDDTKQGWKKTFFLDPTTILLPPHRIKLATEPAPKIGDDKLAKNSY